MYSNLRLVDDGTYVLRADSERFGKDAIIFQSPLKNDLLAFLKKELLVLDFECCKDKGISDLRKRENKELLGYWRMYFRDGSWHGRWFPESDKNMDKMEIAGLDRVIFYISKRWSKGCDYFMCDDVECSFGAVVQNRYLACPIGNDNYLVMIDTTYGNGDYPCRIYVYRERG